MNTPTNIKVTVKGKTPLPLIHGFKEEGWWNVYKFFPLKIATKGTDVQADFCVSHSHIGYVPSSQSSKGMAAKLKHLKTLNQQTLRPDCAFLFSVHLCLPIQYIHF